MKKAKEGWLGIPTNGKLSVLKWPLFCFKLCLQRFLWRWRTRCYHSVRVEACNLITVQPTQESHKCYVWRDNTFIMVSERKLQVFGLCGLYLIKIWVLASPRREYKIAGTEKQNGWFSSFKNIIFRCYLGSLTGIRKKEIQWKWTLFI